MGGLSYVREYRLHFQIRSRHLATSRNRVKSGRTVNCVRIREFIDGEKTFHVKLAKSVHSTGFFLFVEDAEKIFGICFGREGGPKYTKRYYLRYKIYRL